MNLTAAVNSFVGAQACCGLAAAALSLLCVSLSCAETGYDAWLRYAPIGERAREYDELPSTAIAVGDSKILRSAKQELARGFNGMLNKSLQFLPKTDQTNAIVIGNRTAVQQVLSEIGVEQRIGALSEEGFLFRSFEVAGKRLVTIVGGSDRATLYGVFAFLRRIACGEPVIGVEIHEEPSAPVRILNHWDNLDGTIERGYAGLSIFWEDGHVVKDTTRVNDYARLMASVGINGCSINNVNADARVVTPAYLEKVSRIAAAFRPWGVRMYISLNFASPREVGGVKTFDPLDPDAVAFWKRTVDEVYRVIPDLGGFVLKADSEGRLGPSEYGRTPADAANVIARALKPHGGTLFYRGFVYNHKMDWRDLKNDRAKAAYDNFHKLDGKFEDNVVIQIKHGPIDFQVREPASPLFGGLERTNMAIELQITQEYLGQQRHVCFTAPMWKEVLDFDMQAKGVGTPVKQLVSGKTFDRPTGGFVGVSNVGRDANWLGHHLAMANLYAFGRLAWNPEVTSKQIADEWTRQTFGNDAAVVENVVDILLRSWPIYESYTGPFGIGTLTDIIHIHFGPAPESSEYNGWGQWHRANGTGVGMDRTVSTGTGFTAQYRPQVAEIFESIDTCPEDLLLFMHHVPYTHRLRSGQTLIQRFYDLHYHGAEDARSLVDVWRGLEHRMDDQRYREVLERLEFQAGHAQVWRDSICRWFNKRSGIADEKGRVGNYPDRLEAEDHRLRGYRYTEVKPWEAASGRGGVELPSGVATGEIAYRYQGEAAQRDLRVQYFDEEDGVSKFKLFAADKLVEEWIADQHVPTPTTVPDAHSSTCRMIRGVTLKPGDEIRIEGTADGGERAAVDYIELLPPSAAK